MPVKTSTREAATPIGLRIPFTTGGALSGQAYTGNDYLHASLGQLSTVWIDPFVNDRPVYVVYSYLTPIAWYSPLRGWVSPERQYSRTTSVHQGVVRRAIAAHGDEYTTTVTS